MVKFLSFVHTVYLNVSYDTHIKEQLLVTG